jgi:hypothetical protein
MTMARILVAEVWRLGGLLPGMGCRRAGITKICETARNVSECARTSSLKEENRAAAEVSDRQ